MIIAFNLTEVAELSITPEDRESAGRGLVLKMGKE